MHPSLQRSNFLGGNMKALILTFISIFSLNTFASDFLKCEFKIPDNKVKCPLIGSCPQKILKTSETSLLLELHDGVTESGEITMNKILIDPGTKKEAKSDIVLFSDDQRFLQLQDKVDLVDYEVGERINYSAIKYGDSVNLSFNSSVYRANWVMRGNIVIQNYLLTSESAVNIKCQPITRAVYEEQDRKKKAVEEFKIRKEEKEKSSAREA
jgi:hypothetical protein